MFRGKDIARYRIVSANVILDEEVDLRDYPYRLLAVCASGGGLRRPPMTEALAVLRRQ